MRIREATRADLDLLVRHRKGMWRDIGGYSDAELDEADAPYRVWADAGLRDGTLLGLVVEEAGAPIASGCVWLMRVQPRPRHPTGVTPYLLSMFTEHAHRGKGTARAIVEHALAWCKEKGHPRLVLHASDAGRPIYEKLGFVRTWEMKKDL